jgi:hypothetical protein
MHEEMILEKGETFPSDKELSRIKKQQQWDDMFTGVFNNITRIITTTKGTAEAQKVDPLVPLPAVVSEINGDLLFGEFPLFMFGEEGDALTEQVLEWEKKRKTFMTDILGGATSLSALGTIFWVMFKMGDKVFYKFEKPMQVIWDEDILGLTKVWLFKELERDKNNKWVRYELQEHKFDYDEEEKSPYLDDKRKGTIQDIVIKVNVADREIKEVINGEVKESGFNFLPIIKIDNLQMLNKKNGKSDYQGKEQLFAEIDNRVDEINHILQEHSEPWTFVPPGVLDNKGNFNRSQGKMIEKAASSNTNNAVDILTWDGQLQASFDSIKMMIQLVLFTSRISNPIAGFFFDNSGGQVDSGRALKWKSINTNSMITRKRKNWDEAFQTFFTYLFEMDDEFKKTEDFNLRVKWQDGLPLDVDAVVDNVIKQVGAKVLSKKTGIQQINEVSPEKAQTELDQINAELQTETTTRSTAFRQEI